MCSAYRNTVSRVVQLCFDLIFPLRQFSMSSLTEYPVSLVCSSEFLSAHCSHIYVRLESLLDFLIVTDIPARPLGSSAICLQFQEPANGRQFANYEILKEYSLGESLLSLPCVERLQPFPPAFSRPILRYYVIWFP